MIAALRTVTVVFSLACSSASMAQATGDIDTQGAKFPWPETAPATSPATTAPAAEVRGSLAVRAVQGTQGGQPIGKVPVEIDLLHRGVLVDTIRTQTDEHGVVMVEDLPIALGVQPVVRVLYADLTYQVQSKVLDPSNPQQQIDVVCYDPTDRPPPWHVQMRHIMVAQAPGGVEVTEVMVLENPDTRTWIGVLMGGSKRITTAFQLPHEARDVKLGGGFHDWCCTSILQGRLVNHLPLMPEKTQMTYSYFIPATQGKAELDIIAPSAVDHTMLLLPESLAIESVTGLEPGGTQDTGTGVVRAFMASNTASGGKARVVLAGMQQAGPAPAAPTSGASAQAARVVVIVGGILLVIVAAAVFLLRGKNPLPPATA